MMMSGVISDTIGMLPAMKMTEPYSPTARANAIAKPVSSAGAMAGKMTRQKVCQRVAPRQAAALVNEHEGSQARLLKYESILLLVLRLLYLQKRESLAASADEVLVTVEEVQAELQKMNLPRKLDQQTLEKLMRTPRRYNMARPVGRLCGLDSRSEVLPTVLLALPDAALADAAAESARTRAELGLYERPEGADMEAGEGEA